MTLTISRFLPLDNKDLGGGAGASGPEKKYAIRQKYYLTNRKSVL